MKLSVIATNFLAATIKQRVPGSAPIYALARRIVAAYENNDVNIDSNGEAWLLGKLFEGRPIVALDVGANEGDWTAVALKAGRDCTVYCYEPVPTTFAVLQANTTDGRAKLFNKALSSEPGTLEINSVVGASTLSSVVDFGKYASSLQVEKIQIEASTGDRELQALGLTHVDMLKVDVEGHDLDVLLGFKTSLAEGRIDVIQFEYNIFTHMTQRSLREFYDLLWGDFLICRLLPNGLEACRYHTNLEDYRQTNWIALRRAIIDPALVSRLRIRPARGQSPEELGYPA